MLTITNKWKKPEKYEKDKTGLKKVIKALKLSNTENTATKCNTFSNNQYTN